MQIQIVRKQKEIELAEQEAARKKKIRGNCSKISGCRKYSAEKEQRH